LYNDRIVPEMIMSKKPDQELYHCALCGQRVWVRQPAEHGIVCPNREARRGSM